MSTKKVTSKHQKDLYATYKASNKFEVNRKKKLQRQLKLNPGNAAQIEAALKNISYRRKTPKKANDTTPKTRNTQLPKFVGIPEKVMNRIKYRAHDGKGNLLWTS